MAEKSIAIYVLIEPFVVAGSPGAFALAAAVRYVGQTQDPRARLKRHISDSRSGKRRRDNWVRSLAKAGLSPELIVLEEAPSTRAANDRERWWVATMRQMGARLTNATDGGDGVRGFVWPRELVERLNTKRRGRVQSPEERAMRVAAMAGVFSPEYRARLSVAQCGVWADPEKSARRLAGIRSQENRTKLRAIQLGKKGRISDAGRLAIAEATKRRIASDPAGEARRVEKIRARAGSPVRRARQSIITKARYSTQAARDAHGERMRQWWALRKAEGA